MNEDSLERVLNATPPPDATAKKRAINLAMAEFEAAKKEVSQKSGEFDQGFWARLRLTFNLNKGRTQAMALSSKKQMILGASTVCLLVTSAVLLRDKPVSPMLDSPPVTNEDLFAKRLPSAQDAPIEESIATDKDANHSPPLVVQFRDSLAKGMDMKREASPPRQEPLKESEMKVTAERASPGVRAAAPKASGKAKAADVAVNAPKEMRDRFATFAQNAVTQVAKEPVSTFSVDVDTASYSYVRRQLNSGVLPQKDAVRIEELINYFDYQYPLPESKSHPFKPTVVVTDSPWQAGNKLIHIGIKGYEIAAEKKPKTNLVFLLDVSGSMESDDKLPLVKQAMGLLLDNLNPEDTVAIAVYAGAAGTVLAPTPVKNKSAILAALNRLSAGGSTAGGEGIQLAYQLAEQHFDKNAVNRIILATDGDFNVGLTNDKAFKDYVERKRDKGIYLSILGFGQGNYQDALMQTLAQSGNGIAAYIDTLSEAQKVLVTEANSTLFPIANDVKIQVEFNPATVKEYRLIGYETRALKQEDFNNDKIDAGDIGAGHRVTAIYEITPVDATGALLDESRYQKPVKDVAKSDEYGFLKLRYKLPGQQTSQLLTQSINTQTISLNGKEPLQGIHAEVGFATAVAGFAQLLKGGHYTGGYSYDDVIALANLTKGSDDYGYRTEFVQLVRKAKIAKAL